MTDEGELIAGRYRLISRLGSGAMGVVWQAQDERLHRTVAVKQLLLPSGLGHLEGDEASRRAMREGRITARLHHPHAIAVYDVAEHEGQPYLIMEYLPSSSLATVLSVQGVLLPDKVARIGSQIASALAAAHTAGIVHRDIKPGNVLLADDGTVKITDFGISHAVGDVTVTATGILAGTPAYLAPEVAQGGSAGFPSDVFSLGSTLYTALEGTPPFGLDNNAIALLHRVALGEITPPRQSGPLTLLLLHLLHRNPELRPTMQQAADSLATLAADLARPQGGPPAPTLKLSQDDPTVPRTRQAFIRSAPPEKTTTPAAPIAKVDAAASPPPTEGDRDGSPGHRRLLAGALAVVVLTGVVLATVFISDGEVTGGNATGGNATRTTSTSDVPAQGIPPVPTPSAPSSTTQVAIPTISATPGDAQSTSEQRQAITDYYALMPEDLPTAWERLTADYQQNHAGGFAGYQEFWNLVQRVTVSDVSVQQGGAVDATIEYLFKDGRTVEERTSYGLLAEDGVWKIDSSTVRSSQTKQVG
ncbi:MAG TPA: protein kinase [Pseudonocardiaceae bacterium]|nr:protein kinase [Pseudonocardiaceae bacterium]